MRPREPRWVCIMTEQQCRRFESVGINFRCSGGNHQHIVTRKVVAAVRAGEMEWVGRHRKIAKYTHHRTWAKVYTRNEAGEVICCNMQLIRGNAK